jgi:2-amino-4-hydroxy-6-hydroxymethyldihydropteridine diphosphokinase
MGSNLGDRFEHLRSAAVTVGDDFRTCAFELSSIYATSPREGVDGGEFLNCAMTGIWTSDAETLLDLCRRAELKEGSETVKNGSSRSLDVDLLFFGELTRVPAGIVLPHPRMHLRNFVLVPLSEVWIGGIPGLGRTAAELLAECTPSGHIIRVADKPLPGDYWS